MHIEFLLAAREDFHWQHAALRIGSAPDNDLVLAVNQAAPHHARVIRDDRGWVLEVLPRAGHVYVNARPVRERALLREGDVLSVGDCRLLLCADEDPSARSDTPRVADSTLCTVALRVVAGPLSGKVLPVSGQLELGPRGRYPLDLAEGEVATLRIAWRDGYLVLDAQDATPAHPVRVNGRRVRSARLAPGDQIGIAMHRFVLEAPGMRPEPKPAPLPPPPPARPADPGHGGAWWLILTATVLALVIALFLSIRL